MTVPPDPETQFEAKVGILVRALIAILMTVSYVAFVAFDIEVTSSFVLLVGASVGFFLGGVNPFKR